MYDLNRFRSLQTHALARHCKRLGSTDRVSLALSIVYESGVPCIVAAYITGEIYGFSSDLLRWIGVLEGHTSNNRVKNRLDTLTIDKPNVLSLREEIEAAEKATIANLEPEGVR